VIIRLTRLTVLILLLSIQGPASAEVGSDVEIPSEGISQDPVRIILYIGDGVGVSYWTAALFAADSLAICAFPVAGLVDTRAEPEMVTDSAASATAYSTGVSTYNGAIGVGPDRQPRETVLERAEKLGLATGLVATCAITHATPAAFASHVESRGMQNEIALQISRQGIEVILGGGRDYFDRSPGPDEPTILQSMQRTYIYVEDPAGFRAINMERARNLLGLFDTGHMPGFDEREPTLPEMTRAALTILNRDPEGFFLMVEGSQPDWRGHDNASLEEVVAEVLDFDRAVRAGLDYRMRHPETLIVVVSDHETGGLAVEGASGNSVKADYTTTGHTAQMTPLFAVGPGAERFGGIRTNSEIGRLLLDIVDRRTE